MVEPLDTGDDAVPSAVTDVVQRAPVTAAKTFSLSDIWHRIQHHKVMHWTLAYAAAGYTLLHGVEMVSNSLSWPHIIARVLTLVLIIGVPVVITLAWYHGEKGLQKVSGPELVILTVLLTIGGSILWMFARGADHEATTAEQMKAAGVPLVSDKSVAVLPFVNLSSSADDEYLSDGLADTLLQMLTQVPDLKVIARTSSFSFKGKNEDVRSIARQLGVATILEGSVQRSGERLRVIAQLINAKDGTHLWSKTYDRTMTDVFSVQDEIATQVSVALSTSLVGAKKDKAKYTPSIAAYQEYLRGRQALAPRTVESLKSAIKHFQKSIELEPDYALAYASLADAYIDSAAALFTRPVMLQRANAAVQQALRLDPELGEAQSTLATVREQRNDFFGVEPAYRRALELAPGDARAHQRYGLYLATQGRYDEARVLLDQALTLDPRSAVIQVSSAEQAWRSGETAEAMGIARRAIELDASSGGTYLMMSNFLQAEGRVDEAVRYRKKSISLDRRPGPVSSLANMYSALGDEALADAAYRETVRDWPEEALALDLQATIALRDGRVDEAVQYAARSIQLNPVDSVTAHALLAVTDLNAGRADAALSRLRSTYPELLGRQPSFTPVNVEIVPRLAQVLIATGQSEPAARLLAAAEVWVRARPRGALRIVRGETTLLLPRVLTLEGKQTEALKQLRTSIDAGDGYDWPSWSKDSVFAAIADAPEFKQCVEIVRARNAKQLESLRKQPDLAPI